MQIVPSDHNCPLHLQFLYYSTQDASTDGDVSCEGAFLINVSSEHRLKGIVKSEQTEYLRDISNFTFTLHIQNNCCIIKVNKAVTTDFGQSPNPFKL